MGNNSIITLSLSESKFKSYNVVLTYNFVDGILQYDRSNKNSRVVLSCGNVYCAVQGGSNFRVHG